MSHITRLKGHGSIVRITSDHYPLLKKWYKARGLKVDLEGNISDTGFIADGRVAGWLYVTNSNTAFIEGLISNPDTVPSLRRQSTRKLMGFLIDTALFLGFESIFAISRHPSVAKLAEEFAFKENSTLKVYTMNIRNE